MQHDNKHTDKKLQELENQSLPDLSKMDAHWQQMKTMLQPAAMPAKPKNGSVRKFFRWTVAAVFVAGSCFLVYQFAARKNNGIKNGAVVHQSSNDTTPSGKTANEKNTPAIKSLNQPKPLQDTFRIEPGKQPELTKQFIIMPAKKQAPPPVLKFSTPVSPDKKDTLRIVPATKDESASLAKFFKQLEKEPQIFLINNSRDTLIAGAEGTELFIPANCFGKDKRVTIRLQEFYSYRDMIAHRLTTTSDGKQLITGGMLNIRAFENDKEITHIQNALLINMPAKKYDKDMQLFLPQQAVQRENPDKDALAVNTSALAPVNWIPFGQNQGFSRGMPLIKVLNLTNSFKVHYPETGVAKFLIAKNCPLSNEEVKEEMKRRYGYKKVKVRRVWSGVRRDLFSNSYSLKTGVGDSIWLPFDYTLRLNLVTREDSAKFVQDLRERRMRDSITYMTVSKLESKYNFRISTLGWINCDRFYNDPRPKIDYYVTLREPMETYQAMLVFDNIRSIMQGHISGNKLVFANVPEGESAKVISVAVQNGKTVAAMENIMISRTPFNGLKFEDTDPIAFKQQTSIMDK